MTVQNTTAKFAARQTAGRDSATSTGDRYYLRGELVAEWLNATTVRLYRTPHPDAQTARHLTAIASAISGTTLTINKQVLAENPSWTMTVHVKHTTTLLATTGEALVEHAEETLSAPAEAGLTGAILALRAWADRNDYDYDAADEAASVAMERIQGGVSAATVLRELHDCHVGY